MVCCRSFLVFKLGSCFLPVKLFAVMKKIRKNRMCRNRKLQNKRDNVWKMCKLFIKQRKNVDKFRITSLFVDKSDFMQPLPDILGQ